MKARALLGGWRRGAPIVLLGAALGAVLAAGALRSPGPVLPTPGVRASLLTPAAAPVDADQAEDARCLLQRAELMRLPSLALPASSDPAVRAQLLGRTKGTPVLFVRRPDADSSPLASALRAELDAWPGYEAFGRVVSRVRREPALVRAVFLRDGYLYTESPELASLYGSLTLSLLFRDAELRIERGAQEVFARRLEDGDYEYTSGEERGRRAKLRLFDRVATRGASLGEPAHADLRPIAEELGFDELVLNHASPGFLVADAVYGELRVPTVLRVHEGRTALACEAPGNSRAPLLARREEAARAAQARTRLVSVIQEQVDEGLPFDEPKTEEGQQDGKLRPEWRRAYLEGGTSFEFNGDRYAVFDDGGRPRPPQVCIDFVLDTFERASGSWWGRRGEPRQRPRGRFSFDHTTMDNRRSVERFLEFARAHGEAFEVYDSRPEDRVPLRSRSAFFAMLYRTRAQFRRGDIVAILGPRDDEKLHYHSFFIVASDPLSGFPIELAANAGRPRIRSWEGEMSSAPRRAILARVRPRQVWLESFLSPEGRDFGPGYRQTDVSADPPRVAPGPDGKGPAAG